MDMNLERQFLKALDDAVTWCAYWMTTKYGCLQDENQKEYRESLLKEYYPLVVKACETLFDVMDSVGYFDVLKILSQKIDDNLLQLSEDKRKIYAISLIAPLSQLGCKSAFEEILRSKKGILENPEEVIESVYQIVEEYGQCLYALFLKYGLDLFEMQEQIGVQLIEERCVPIIDDLLGSEYLAYMPKGKACKPQQQPPAFPEELDTTKARELINRAVKAGFITVKAGWYKWNGTKVLLAYFAFKATAYLNMKTIADATVSWKPFETLFQVKNLKQAKATDYGKYDENFKPHGREKIDALFENSGLVS